MAVRDAASGRTWRMPRRGESLAGYVRAARMHRGLTWDDMVRQTGLSLGTVRKIEEGRTGNPGVFTLLRLWRVLDLPAHGFVQLEPPASERDK